MRSVLRIAPLLVATSYGAIDSCGPADYETFWVSFMQGFQSDTTSTDTECYAKNTLFVAKLNSLFGSFSPGTFSSDDFAAPLYIAAETAVSATDVFTYC